MPALRLLVFLISLANANTGLADGFPRWQWQVVEAEFSDIGHYLMTEVLEYNLTLPRADGTDGVYTKSFKRDGDAVTCPRVGNFRTSYSAKLDQSLNSDDAYIATVTFRNCEQKVAKLVAMSRQYPANGSF